MSPDRITWRETSRRLAQDRQRVRAMLASRTGKPPLLLWLYPSYLCALLHRISHYWWRRGSGKVSRIFYQLNTMMTGADIDPHCDLGGGLLIPNPTGVTLSGKAGENLTVGPYAGFGFIPPVDDVGAGPGLPVLGDGVAVGMRGGVLGPVRIGDGVRVREGCIVTRDVPAGAVVEQSHPPAPAPEPEPVEARPGDRRCDHRRPLSLWRDIREDVDRYLLESARFQGERRGLRRRVGALLSAQIAAVAIHRFAHLLHANRLRRTALLVSWINVLVSKLTINPASCIGGGFFLPHPTGVVFSGRAGRGVVVFPASVCTSLGGALTGSVDEGPTLGDRVVIGSSAGIVGRVQVGNDTTIGFRVDLLEHAPPDSVVTSAAMKVRIS